MIILTIYKRIQERAKWWIKSPCSHKNNPVSTDQTGKWKIHRRIWNKRMNSLNFSGWILRNKHLRDSSNTRQHNCISFPKRKNNAISLHLYIYRTEEENSKENSDYIYTYHPFQKPPLALVSTGTGFWEYTSSFVG